MSRAPSADSLAADEIYDYGEYLSAECVTCHRREENADGIPAIVGWPEARFIEALKSFQNGERTHEIMQNVARSLGEEEMAALARFYRKLELEGD